MATLPLLPATAPFPEEQITALNTVMATANAEQRSWLSGFLAGYQAASQAQPAAAAAPQAKVPLTILFASESGNAEALAGQAKKAAVRLGFAAKVLDAADATPDGLAEAQNLLVIASTWGEGDPPQRAIDVYGGLMAETAPRFDGVRFAVLALGDTAYLNFCETGRRIDDRLEALGGTRIARRVDCDLDFKAPAGSWIDGTLGELRRLDGGPDESGGAVIHVDFARADAAEAETGPVEAEIAALTNLNGSRSTKETLHVELSLGGSGLTYEPGDSLAIRPRNDPAMVEAVLGSVGLAGDDGLHRVLAERYDITALTRPLVLAYGASTGDGGVIALAEDRDRLVSFLGGRQVVDLFEAFPNRLTADQLTTLLRPLPPRLYSIASSLKAAPDEAHLLITALRYRSQGRDRKGVASTFVAERRKVGDRLTVEVRPNKHFRLPSDPGTPIVMIGPGTGVAPFRAFMQEREAVGAAGRSWLFFGDRNYTHDFLYQLEWQDLLASGRLNRLDVAFSRDQPEKVYVQDRLWERRRDLFAWLEEGAHLYVCGDEKRMAKDVHAALLRIVAEQSGKDADTAEAYLAALRRQGRYQRDVY